jgi:hypothetical protein
VRFLKLLLVNWDFKEAAWKCSFLCLSTKNFGFAPSVALAVILAAWLQKWTNKFRQQKYNHKKGQKGAGRIYIGILLL